eukprot:TRINITY_DN7708_c0_g2_i1.p1 TRINITY_DN7708_c0_g2~~TRINITY_DN7708_c0_g2_i1.p1  ORF type:complete len:243 (-),score=64.65 TRINITY_DN7708_c0_g2_i1:5-733(-)
MSSARKSSTAPVKTAAQSAPKDDTKDVDDRPKRKPKAPERFTEDPDAERAKLSNRQRARSSSPGRKRGRPRSASPGKRGRGRPKGSTSKNGKSKSPARKRARHSASNEKEGSDDEYEVEKIIEKRSRVEYKIKWKGYSKKYNEWKTEEELQSCAELIAEFEQGLDADSAKNDGNDNDDAADDNKDEPGTVEEEEEEEEEEETAKTTTTTTAAATDADDKDKQTNREKDKTTQQADNIYKTKQ